jgi:ketosteroid isomerase-like protein
VSQENVEIVTQVYRAIAERRFPSEYLHEDFAWETHPDQPGADTHRGHDAVRAYGRDWTGGWYDVKSDLERLVDHDDRVIALVHGRYRLSEQGVPIEDRYGHIWTLQGGKAVHARVVTRLEALKAVGPEE